MNAVKIIPPIYLFISIAIMVLLHFLFPGTKVHALPWNLLGVIPLAFGIFINLSADRSFKENATTVKPLEKSDRLITTGMFGISRHPMYLGFVGILLGIAMLMGSLMPYIVVLAFAIFMDAVFIRYEEKKLEETFGEAWLQYRRASRRWI
jgi:protein-S-isoprenylcysteine O-methyltransferase Ste14